MPSDEVTLLIIKCYLPVLARCPAPHCWHEVFSDQHRISAGWSWTVANKKCKISILVELHSHGRRLFSSKAKRFSWDGMISVLPNTKLTHLTGSFQMSSQELFIRVLLLTGNSRWWLQGEVEDLRMWLKYISTPNSSHELKFSSVQK